MKIALIGYGKMGKMIEEVALQRGNEIVCRIDKDNLEDFDSPAFSEADVAIEFSTPATALNNVQACLERGVRVVCGTTGWTEHLADVREMCKNGEGTFLWASNFSIGVNIFMAVNRYLAKIMNNFPQYAPGMVETHHIHKLDHPSGTAITLAEQIINSTERIKSWKEPSEGEMQGDSRTSPVNVLEIAHRREGEVPGIHTIEWESDVDEISITHSAKSRAGFALGAVMAAEWLSDKVGWHTLDEMFAPYFEGN